MPPNGRSVCSIASSANLADLPNRLFVSKYQLELPNQEQIQQFIEARLKEALDG